MTTKQILIASEKLFAQVNENNDKIKEEIELLKRKIKMIPNE